MKGAINVATVEKTIHDTMRVLEKNREKLEAKYGKGLVFEPVSMATFALIKKPDGFTYVAYWNLMVKPPRLVIEKVGYQGKQKMKEPKFDEDD
jgi:hypothetical protein